MSEKFGVGPASIPDYLALVGDSADGFPGLAGWGAKSAATVLARWRHIEEIPADAGAWHVTVRGAAKLATTLQEGREEARLFKELATLRIDRSLLGAVDECAGADRQANSLRSAPPWTHRGSPGGRKVARGRGRWRPIPRAATVGAAPENVSRRR